MDDYEGQIGIDLGTTYSCVGVWVNDHVEIIPNQEGSKTTPSWVAFTDTEILVGESAKIQTTMNPENTIFDAKRLLGKHFNSDSVQSDIDMFPFEVVGDRNGFGCQNDWHDCLQASPAAQAKTRSALVQKLVASVI